jgi:acyl carrier protein
MSMNIEESKKIVKKIILEALDQKVQIEDGMQLIGGEALLDSMKLVEVCLSLEDAAEDKGFEFDWTSDAAMSKSRSMFRSVLSLSEEFYEQSIKD